MVVFISQCKKKSLNKARRVLDAFANRIGDRARQIYIKGGCYGYAPY